MAKVNKRIKVLPDEISLSHKIELVVNNKQRTHFGKAFGCARFAYVKSELKLSERTYVCESCGFEKDRDLNAAINLANLSKNSEIFKDLNFKSKIVGKDLAEFTSMDLEKMRTALALNRLI